MFLRQILVPPPNLFGRCKRNLLENAKPQKNMLNGYRNVRSIFCSELLEKRHSGEKGVQEKIIKMLSSRKNLRKKFYDNSNVDSNFINSVTLGQGKVKPVINKNVLIRERNVSSVLVTQIQEVIDTGMVSTELAELQIKITEASMRNKNSCIVYWDSQDVDRDHLIHEALTKYSSKIRHILMHSFVICHVPNLYFHLDNRVITMKKLNKIFNSKDFDSAPSENNLETIQTDKNINLNQTKDWNAKAKSTSSNPMFTLFGIDHESINKAIKLKKESQNNSNLEEDKNNNL